MRSIFLLSLWFYGIAPAYAAGDCPKILSRLKSWPKTSVNLLRQAFSSDFGTDAETELLYLVDIGHGPTSPRLHRTIQAMLEQRPSMKPVWKTIYRYDDNFPIPLAIALANRNSAELRKDSIWFPHRNYFPPFTLHLSDSGPSKVTIEIPRDTNALYRELEIQMKKWGYHPVYEFGVGIIEIPDMHKFLHILEECSGI